MDRSPSPSPGVGRSPAPRPGSAASQPLGRTPDAPSDRQQPQEQQSSANPSPQLRPQRATGGGPSLIADGGGPRRDESVPLEAASADTMAQLCANELAQCDIMAEVFGKYQTSRVCPRGMRVQVSAETTYADAELAERWRDVLEDGSARLLEVVLRCLKRKKERFDAELAEALLTLDRHAAHLNRTKEYYMSKARETKHKVKQDMEKKYNDDLRETCRAQALRPGLLGAGGSGGGERPSQPFAGRRGRRSRQRSSARKFGK